MLYTNPKMQYVYVGVDVHKQTHTAFFMNCFYEKLGEITFSTIPSEFETFYKKAKKYLLPQTTFAWGLEDVSFYGRTFTKFLIAKKQLVKHVNSTLVACERKMQNVPHKTDSLDAECTARVLFSKFNELPIAMPDDKYFILKTMVARHQATVKMRIALKNQFHSLLMDPYPSYQKLFPTIDSKSCLAFFENYPTPAALGDVTVEQLTELLQSQSKNRFGEKKAKRILEVVACEKAEVTDYEDERHFVIRSTITQLRQAMSEIDLIQKQITQFLNHFDYQLTTLKGIDSITAARFIVEIGPIERFSSAAALAKFSGISPITHASGKQDSQFANARGNRKLNELFFRLAMHQVRPMAGHKTSINPLFEDYYNKKISEGKTKKQALKAVSRQLVNIIYSMMKNKEPYLNPPTSKQLKAEAVV